MRGTNATILNLLVETFFAVLPLIVLGAVWPSPSELHPESFWAGPELSMTSCILYGLTLAKWLQGAVFAATPREATSHKNPHEVAASYQALCLLPLLGVIFSVILIGQSVHSPGGTWKVIVHVVNFTLAILTLFILGGFGINLAEGQGEYSDTAK